MEKMEKLSVASRHCENQVTGVISVPFKGCFSPKEWLAIAKKLRQRFYYMLFCMDMFACIHTYISVHIIESWNRLGQKGLKRSSSSKGRDTFHQTRLLKALSHLALNTPRNKASATSPCNLRQCLTTLTVKNFFLIDNLNLPSCSLKMLPFVLSLHLFIMVNQISVSQTFIQSFNIINSLKSI